MNILDQFLAVFGHYLKELFVPLLLGFLFSGIVYEFIPSKIIERVLGQKDLKAVLAVTLLGALLPVCCMGSLPIAVTLRKKGASLGCVLAFLIATPATSLSALFISWRLLGSFLTIYVTLMVVVMGVLIGIVGNAIDGLKSNNHSKECCSDQKEEDDRRACVVSQRWKRALRYAFITLPKSIGFELLLGVVVASLIIIWEPAQSFIKNYVIGNQGYFILLVFGLINYVCATADVLLADAFIKSGITQGQTIVYLICGPITSFGTILVVYKEFGSKVLLVYLAFIVFFSLLAGISYDWFFS